jgi:hypothetical protein
MVDLSKYIHIPIDQIIVPKDRAVVYQDYYWSILVPDHVSIYVGPSIPTKRTILGHYEIYSPQCNKDRRVAAMLPGSIGFVFLPLAYVLNRR